MMPMQEILTRVRAAFPLDAAPYAHVSPALLGLMLSADLKAHGPPILLLVPSEEEGRTLVRALHTFHAPFQARLFPSYPVMPYDFMPLPPSVALHAWKTGSARLLILAAGHLPYPFPAVHPVILRTGQTLDREEFLRRLTALGYLKTSVVGEKAEVAARGFIVDVFSPQMDLPIRIEMDGDTVAGLRIFDPADQR